MKPSDEHKVGSSEFYREVETVFLKVSKTIAVILGLIGLAIIIFQAGHYFNSNHWQPISVISLLIYVNVEWAQAPKSFLFVHQILDVIPLSLCFFALAITQYLSGFIFMKKLKKLLQMSM